MSTNQFFKVALPSLAALAIYDLWLKGVIQRSM